MNTVQTILASAALLTTSGVYADSHSGTLPVLYVNTENNQEITSKEDYLTASYYLESNGNPDIESIGGPDDLQTVEIKGRGNYTWIGFDKKPYKLKFPKKIEFMGMDKNKHFALLAHADDNQGFMRNITGFELSRRLGLAWTPSDKPIEFYLNGDYKGLYFVTQTIRVDKTRVNITEQEDEATVNVDGGWLVEIDNYDTDPHVTVTEHNGYPIYFTYKSPEILSNEQLIYLTEQVNSMNDAIYNSDKNSDEWLQYIDLESAARFYIVQEIMDDCESYHGSCYIYKDSGEGEKWHFGPVWDFGNAFLRGDKEKFIWQDPTFNQTWIGEIYKYPVFQEKVKEVWADFCKNGYNGLEQYIKDYADKIAEAAHYNFARWNQYGNDDVVRKANDMINSIRKSVTWLGDRWGMKPDISQNDPVDIFLRGDFNNWSTSDKFRCIGDNIYEIDLTNIDLYSKEATSFKIASEDWTTVDYGAPEGAGPINLENTYKLEKQGANIIPPAGITNHKMIFNLKDETLLITNGSGVNGILSETDTDTEIYTITGQRVSEMKESGIYILKTPTRTVKIIK